MNYKCQCSDSDGTECSVEEANENLYVDLTSHNPHSYSNKTVLVKRCCLERCVNCLINKND